MSARRAAEDRQAWLRAALTEAQYPAVITDLGGGRGGPLVQFVNPAFCALCGWPAEELVGGPLSRLQGPGTDTAARRQIRAAVMARMAGRAELLNYRRDGSPYWVDLRVVPLRGDSGDATQMLGIARDISTEKRVAMQKRAAEQLLAAVFAITDQGIAVFDEHGCFVAVNRAGSEMLGRGEEELTGVALAQLVPRDSAAAAAALSEAGSAELLRQTLPVLRHDGGRSLLAATSAAVTQEDGRRFRVVTLKPAADVPAEAAGRRRPRPAAPASPAPASPAPSDALEGRRGTLAPFDAAEAGPRGRLAAFEAPPAEAAGMLTAYSGEAFDRSARGMLAGKTPPKSLVAGRLQLVGLDEVKQAVGADWPRMATKISVLAGNIIQARLAPQDVFSQTSEGAFVICFASLSEAEAQFKARAIAQEIRDRLIGDFGRAQAPGVEAEAAKVELSEPELAEGGSLVDLIARKLEARRAELETVAAQTLKQVFDSARMEPAILYGADGRQAPLMLARLDATTLASLAEVGRSRGGNESFAQEVDYLLLGVTAEWVYGHLQDRSAYVVPVDFNSIAHKRLSQRYFGLCRTITQGVRKRLIFQLSNLPPDVHCARIEETINALNVFSRAKMLQLPQADEKYLDFNRYRPAMISMEYPVLAEGLSARDQRLPRLIARAHLYKCRLLVTGVPRAQDATMLQQLGVDFFQFDTAPPGA